MASSKNNQVLSSQGPHCSPCSTAKINDKYTNLTSIGISDVVTASVYSEKTRLKKLMIMIIIIITKKTFTSKLMLYSYITASGLYYSKCSTFKAAWVCGQSYASISHNPTKYA